MQPPKRSKDTQSPPPNHRRRRSKRAPQNGLVGFYATKIRPHITKKRLIIAGAITLVLLIALPLGTYAYYARDIADKERLMNRNNTGVILKDRNGQVFYSSGVRSSKDDVPLSQIADTMEQAVVASEDQDFYSHHGFSAKGTLRALKTNIMNNDATRSGGSTITQQLVKNKLLGSQKNYLRKYQELAMSIAVDRQYSKDEILSMYLNSAYFGNGAFGIADAAQTYFDKTPAELTLAESTMLAGLLPAPTAYSPITGDPEKGKASQANVLRKMVETGKITAAERDEAQATELTYADAAIEAGNEYAQHYAKMVVDQLKEKYGEERVIRSGFEVITTLDLAQQKATEEIIKEQVAKTTDRGGRNSGAVMMDPENGHVLALVGSVDYTNKEFGQVNMATALRQPGSSFKPIYYGAAIDKHLITAATILDDKKTTFGNTYTPRNYDNRYKGEMSVRSALAESRNVPAVQVMQKIGVTEAAKTAQRMGLDSVNEPAKYGLTLALGTAEVRLIDMVSAYTAFANEGMQHPPVYYSKVVDKYGKTIENNNDVKPKRVISDEAAYVISSILSDTAARAPTFGSSLNISRQNVALKTGTTNDNRDAWTIGFTPSVVVGVWLGNNENEPMRSLAGGSGAGATWKRIMTNYLQGKKRQEFTKPSGIVSVSICSGTELRAVNPGDNTRSELFIRGTEPKGVCNEVVEQPKPQEKKQEDDKEKPEGQTNQNDNNNGQGNNGNGNGNEDDQNNDTGNNDDDSGTEPGGTTGGGTSPPKPPSQPPPPSTR